jgi:membrane protease YdiL (CAAX protease family)
VQWVHNLRAAGGRAALRSAGVEQIRLDDVPVERRAPILKEYLRRAPGARPHVPVDKDAPLAAFERIAPSLPVFRIVPLSAPTEASSRAPALFVVLTFLLSIPLWIVGAETGWRIIGGLPVSALAAFCPALAAALLVYRRGGADSVAALLKRSFDFERILNPMWYAAIVLLMPAAMLLTWLATSALGASVAPQSVTLTLVAISFAAFFVAAAGEELGWSGYATEPMQARWGALRAGLLLGVIWSAWHLIPLLQMQRSGEWIAWWTLQTVALRVLIVWFYNRTGRSVFAAELIHTITNVCTVTFANYYDPRVTGIILAVAAAAAAIAWPIKETPATTPVRCAAD